MGSFDKVHCRNEAEVKAIFAVLEHTQKWKIGELQLPDHIEAEGWKSLSKMLCRALKRGKVDKFDTVHCRTDEEVMVMCDVLGLEKCKYKTWNFLEIHLPDDMGADGWSALSKVVGRGELDTFDRVRCKTNKEVRAMCSVLSLVRRWRILELHLPENMEEDSWTALAKVIRGWRRGRGEVQSLHVKGQAFKIDPPATPTPKSSLSLINIARLQMPDTELRNQALPTISQ